MIGNWVVRTVKALLVIMLMAVVSPFPAQAAPLAAGVRDAGDSSVQASARTVEKPAAKTGWVKTKAGKFYYKKGKPVKGLRKIAGAYRYFNAKGVLCTKDITLNGVRFYIDDDGAVIGAKRGSACYYRTLKRMPATDAYNFVTYLKARAVVASVCSKGDTDAEKRRKLFDWLSAQDYTQYHWHKTNWKSGGNWVSKVARPMLEGKGGDCHNSSAAYGYLLRVLGHESRYHMNSWMPDVNHAWIEWNGRRFDPTLAKWNGPTNYYNVTSSGFREEGGMWISLDSVASFSIPWFSARNARVGSKVPTSIFDAGRAGLKAAEGSLCYFKKGKKVRNEWRTIDGKRYYFKKNGVAATGPTKIEGV